MGPKVGGLGIRDATTTNYYKSDNHRANYLAAGKKGGQAGIKKRLKRKAEYEKQPKLCVNCADPLDYDKKRNKFCSKSCSAKYNNTGRVVTDTTRRKTSATLRNHNKLRD